MCSSSSPSATDCSALVIGGDLGEDVDAVLLLVDHPLQAARLALDATQPPEVVVLLMDVAVLVRHDLCRLVHGSPLVRTTTKDTPDGYSEHSIG